ncbi:MAG TPA: hypothetical protein DCR14_00755 [Acidimicrobiaceae bacterium]|nr:hypothetical protein [Acidimicrobiaceae bacterium]
MMVLIFILVGSLLVLPLLNYTAAVVRASKVQRDKISSAEAARGGLRAALSDPSALYEACGDSGLHLAVQLADPGFSVPVDVECTTVKSAQELESSELRVAMTVTEAGALTPQGVVGDPFVGNGSLDPSVWINSSSNTSEGDLILLPLLPSHALNHPATGGYMMPSWAGSCRVFFPGTYDDPVTINDSIPTYFASGIYYFESTITFSGPANVVIGQGAIPGCTEDQDAAFNAINAPFTPNVSGLGATFIFGGAGRMVVTDGGATQGPSVKFNSRLVDPTDVGSTVSAGVSIVTVNGVPSGGSSAGLDIPGRLMVPNSYTETNPGDANPPVDAVQGDYTPSSLIPSVSPDPPVPAVIEVSFMGAGSSTLYVPGYVGVPQGAISVYVAPGYGMNKSVQLVGGVLAARVEQSVDLPADSQIGMVNRIVQKTFKLVATTSGPTGVVTSVAIVQVNDYGEYAINSWVTTGA